MKSKNIKNLWKRVASVTLAGALVLSTGIPAKEAQSYATAANTMDNMVADGTIADATEVYGYVDAISLYDDNGDATGLLGGGYTEAGYYGWQYGVIRDGKYVASSALISASAFDLQDGDTVVWVYALQSAATDFFGAYDVYPEN